MISQNYCLSAGNETSSLGTDDRKPSRAGDATQQRRYHGKSATAARRRAVGRDAASRIASARAHDAVGPIAAGAGRNGTSAAGVQNFDWLSAHIQKLGLIQIFCWV